VAVPEAAMDKNDGLVAGEDDVGATWKLFVVGGVNRKAIAGTVEQAAELNFWLGVISLDPRHVPGTSFFCQVIGHLGYCKS
jgi:hypothetical protein